MTLKKAISTHRWFLANSNRDKVDAEYLGILSCNFNISKNFEYTIEVLEGFMDMFETFKEGDQLELLVHLIEAYIDSDKLVKEPVLWIIFKGRYMFVSHSSVRKK